MFTGCSRLEVGEIGGSSGHSTRPRCGRLVQENGIRAPFRYRQLPDRERIFMDRETVVERVLGLLHEAESDFGSNCGRGHVEEQSRGMAHEARVVVQSRTGGPVTHPVKHTAVPRACAPASRRRLERGEWGLSRVVTVANGGVGTLSVERRLFTSASLGHRACPVARKPSPAFGRCPCP